MRWKFLGWPESLAAHDWKITEKGRLENFRVR